MVKKLLRDFYAGFREYGHDVASIVNFILLLLVYIVGVGPVSIIAKIFKKHFLDLKFKHSNSKWVARKPVESIDEHYRQF